MAPLQFKKTQRALNLSDQVGNRFGESRGHCGLDFVVADVTFD
jgi:hypothetical protein